MNTQKMNVFTTMAATCALALVSTAAFGSGRSMGVAPGAGGTHAAAATHMSAPSSPAAAAKAPTTRSSLTTRKTGQPNASCEDTPNQPGHSISAPGSAFNPDGVAGTKYAGQQPQNSRNPNSVSQYDVACTRPTH